MRVRHSDLLATALIIVILVMLAVSISLIDSDEECARDMRYYLTPYQRQILLDKNYTPSFNELEEHCTENNVTFAQILEASEKLAKFR